MWNKILEINWRSRFGNRSVDARAPIEGTNGATEETMTRVNKYIRRILNVVEAPVYGAAVFFILIMGEWNFFSKQVYYQTEPMTAIGQWAPMAGTGLAVLGSLYLKIHKDLVFVKEDDETPQNEAAYPHEPSMSERPRDQSPSPSPSRTRGAHEGRQSPSNGGGPSPERAHTIEPLRRAHTTAPGRTYSESTPPTVPIQRAFTLQDLGGRRRIARTLIAISDRIGSATPNHFDDSSFKQGQAIEYPTIPAEEQRHKGLGNIKSRYKHARDVEGAATPRRSHSRSGSFTSVNSTGLGINLEGSSSQRTHSPRRPLPAERNSGDLELSHTTSGPNGVTPQRRPTLEVPPTSHHSSNRRTLSGSSIIFTDSPEQGPSSPALGSPAIVVSPDPQEPDPEAEFAVE
jgi:hypothetical protein